MQTFLPYSDFQKCAEVLDGKRLRKQIVECEQILNCLSFPEVTKMACDVCGFRDFRKIFKRGKS